MTYYTGLSFSADDGNVRRVREMIMLEAATLVLQCFLRVFSVGDVRAC